MPQSPARALAKSWSSGAAAAISARLQAGVRCACAGAWGRSAVRTICAAHPSFGSPAFGEYRGSEVLSTAHTHCDLVVGKPDQTLEAIGGNVRNSVSKSVLELDAEGRLQSTPRRPWFLVLQNRLQPDFPKVVGFAVRFPPRRSWTRAQEMKAPRPEGDGKTRLARHITTVLKGFAEEAVDGLPRPPSKRVPRHRHVRLGGPV